MPPQQTAQAVNVKAPLTLQSLLLIVACLLAGVGTALSAGLWISTVNARLTTNESANATTEKAWRDGIAAAEQRGRENREAIARRSIEMNQAQQSEIDRLRVEQQSQANTLAALVAKMDVIAGGVARIEGWLRPGSAR